MMVYCDVFILEIVIRAPLGVTRLIARLFIKGVSAPKPRMTYFRVIPRRKVWNVPVLGQHAIARLEGVARLFLKGVLVSKNRK